MNYLKTSLVLKGSKKEKDLGLHIYGMSWKIERKWREKMMYEIKDHIYIDILYCFVVIDIIIWKWVLAVAKGLPWERYKGIIKVELWWFFCMDGWERHIFKEIDLWEKEFTQNCETRCLHCADCIHPTQTLYYISLFIFQQHTSSLCMHFFIPFSSSLFKFSPTWTYQGIYAKTKTREFQILDQCY